MDYSEALSQKIEACRELYLKHGGEHHDLIEREMRSLGYHDFHRRSLYRRFERGTCKPGWIETYGWRSLLRNSDRGLRIEEEEAGGNATSDGNAGIPACQDAKASNRDANILATGSADTLHAGGTGVAGRDACVSADAAATPPAYASGSASDFDEFLSWLKRVSPGMEWEWRHQVYIYKYLERVSSGDCKRLMIFLPPRHGKSELVTVRYAAWRLKQDPSMNVIIGSYNQSLANRFSRKIRRVITDNFSIETQGRAEDEKGRKGEEKKGRRGESEKVGAEGIDRVQPDRRSDISSSPLLPFSPSSSLFPFVSSRPKNSEAEWETSMGGGLRAVGVGSGVTGFGADLIIIDDPVKSRAEAESQTYRDNLWDWFNDDLYTRLEPDGSIILIQTRWHEDDLAGRLLRESQQDGGEHWEVVNLPALAEAADGNAGIPASDGNAGIPACQDAKASDRDANIHSTDTADTLHAGGTGVEDKSVLAPSDPLGRSEGEALCPERYNEEKLERIRRKLGSYSFSALYQQQPSPAEGGKFKRAWFRKIIDAAPEGLSWKRGYDLAVSTKQTADYTASFRCAKDKQGNLYIADGFRARIEYPDQRRYILERMRAEKSTEHGIEAALHGRAFVQDLRRELGPCRFAFRAVRVDADKLTRALAWLNLAEEGKVYLVRGPWIDEFLDEIARFPTGRYDDQIDAVSLSVNMLERRSGKLVTC